MAVPVFEPFDPLVDLAGLWTTRLAERYLPLDDLPPAKYECVDGGLVVSPREGSGNSYATVRLTVLLDRSVAGSGFVVYSSINMQFGEQTWLEPDLAVLRTPAEQITWVPVSQLLMPVEFVSRSSRRRDRIDKPALCAQAGVPYFLRVEIAGARVYVELLRLVEGRYELAAKALSGQEFRTELPFPIAFDPVELLEPGVRHDG